MAKRIKPKWTVMVYLAGDNDLPAYCIGVLQQLEEVNNYRDDICVLGCFDSGIPWPRGSRYFRINCKHSSLKKTIDWEMHNDLIMPSRGKNGIPTPTFCEENGNQALPFSREVVRRRLKRFIDWSVRKHADSDRYMLILFGHGPIIAGQNFLVANNPASFLGLKDLKEVLSENFGLEHERKLDILAFQNCVMNNIELASELKDEAHLMVGSQGLVLAMGWPHNKIISALNEKPDASTEEIASKMLKVCARNMLDYSVMDRSSEQSVCNLTKLAKSEITLSVRKLAEALIQGLDFTVKDEKEKDEKGKGKGKERVLTYPAICDAVRLARLDAQSYWGENFVDLYDFCERLILKCDDIVRAQRKLLKNLELNREVQQKFQQTGLMKIAREIARCCEVIRKQFKELVPYSYYIGPELQYSRGLSIYFPWTLPAAPFFSTPKPKSQDFSLKTAFEIYREYSFVQASDWGRFLDYFFRATLRNVRRADRDFILLDDPDNPGLVEATYHQQPEFVTGDLGKSSPDTGIIDHDIWSNVKNYPRRSYLSPADCPRKINEACALQAGTGQFTEPDSPPVSSWGWNITGLVAEVIQKKTEDARKNGKAKAVAAAQK